MSDSFSARTGYTGSIHEVVKRVIKDNYNLGTVKHSKLIDVGMEDYNLQVTTDTGEYLVKIVTIKRDDAEANRYIEIMQAVIDAGVSHPKLYRDTKNRPIYTDTESSMRFVVMEFIAGKTFYDMKRSPDESELDEVLTIAINLHAMKYRPPYSFDSWAIPNIHWLYQKTVELMDEECIKLVNESLDLYDKIPIDQLPTCFIHGDMVPTNLIKDSNGKLYIFDFAVANVYPKIQELAVIAADLLEESGQPVKTRVKTVCDSYIRLGGSLNELEIDSLHAYTLAAMAIEIMGGHYEKYINKGDNLEEIDWYINMGKSGLKDGLGY